MRLHRFYLDPKKFELDHQFWVNDESIVHQWQKVLRYKVGQELIIFDGIEHDRLYRVIDQDQNGVKLELVTEMERKIPKYKSHLFFSLLKKDKNDWILMKATELGVTHFVPVNAQRSEKNGFNIDRAKKIIIEAAEQCGRSDIPVIREPVGVQEVVKEYASTIPLYVAEQGTESVNYDQMPDEFGVLVGPEGGWSNEELQQFKNNNLNHISISDFTLRAETAVVAVLTKLL